MNIEGFVKRVLTHQHILGGFLFKEIRFAPFHEKILSRNGEKANIVKTIERSDNRPTVPRRERTSLCKKIQMKQVTNSFTVVIYHVIIWKSHIRAMLKGQDP